MAGKQATKGAKSTGKNIAKEKTILEEIDDYSEQVYPYVVRGATIYCTAGTHIRALDLPKTHGVFMRGGAAMNEDDSKHIENPTSESFGNIPIFGICLSNENENEAAQTLHTEDLIFPLMGIDIEELDLPITGKRCTPSVSRWIGAKEDTLVDGKPALTVECTLVCATGGGCIAFINDGQKADEDMYFYEDE